MLCSLLFAEDQVSFEQYNWHLKLMLEKVKKRIIKMSFEHKYKTDRAHVHRSKRNLVIDYEARAKQT